MNAFSTRLSTNQAWVLPVSAMGLVLGFMIAMANVTGSEVRKSRLRLTDPDLQNRLDTGSLDIQERYRDLLAEVNKLRQENTELQNAMSDQTNGTRVLNDQLQEAKVVAGLMEVQGPGVLVTLSDSRRSQSGNRPAIPNENTPEIPLTDQIIHDQDVLRVVNELWAAGAEAISINNLRLGPTSSVRCVGPVVHIDGVKVASPIRIRALGSPETLTGALNLPGGILDELRSVDPNMVRLESIKMMKLPAYTGPTSRRYAVVPQAKQSKP